MSAKQPVKTPQPRNGRYFGMAIVNSVDLSWTWLEGEEFAYPAGGFTRRAYAKLSPNVHAPIDLPYGELRVVSCSIPDTAWTIPARLRYKGKTIPCYLDTDTSGPVNVLRVTPCAMPEVCANCKPNEGCKKGFVAPTIKDSGINLDGLSTEELWDFDHKTRVSASKTARGLFPAKPAGYVLATKNLGHYAANKATAQKLRIEGNIARATEYEGICERIYERLPEYARW